jgi:Mlc titration factor MtfA (ptsG expression regulator)
MRTTPFPEGSWSRVTAALVGATGLGVGALAAGVIGGVLGLSLALGGYVLARHWSRARFARRRALLAGPFPEAFRDLLRDRCDHYDRLPEHLRDSFESDLRVFLAEKRVTGVGIKVTDELRVLVAASAVTLSLGWREYEWDQLAEVLLYPDDFDRDYQIGASEISGQAHSWGTVILSAPALEESFDDPDDAYHVGFHEFAHLLDVEHTHFDGIPVGFDEAHARRWIEIREREMERLRRGHSVLDDYGAHDPVEFLAVAVEAFFETALALRQRHRELYELLVAYFRQDPAAWDDARGLRL